MCDVQFTADQAIWKDRAWETRKSRCNDFNERGNKGIENGHNTGHGIASPETDARHEGNSRPSLSQTLRTGLKRFDGRVNARVASLGYWMNHRFHTEHPKITQNTPHPHTEHPKMTQNTPELLRKLSQLSQIKSDIV